MNEVNNPEQKTKTPDVTEVKPTPEQLKQQAKKEQEATDNLDNNDYFNDPVAKNDAPAANDPEQRTRTPEGKPKTEQFKPQEDKDQRVDSNLDGSSYFNEDSSEKKDVSVKLHNTEKTLSGRELTEDEAEVNNKFRGDQFKEKDSYNESITPPEKRKAYVEANYASTCHLNENLKDTIKTNDEYKAKMTEAQNKLYSELKEKRSEVPEITEHTVMQKVITEDAYQKYIDKERTTVKGCASKASDITPYTNNVEEAYKNIRLDYPNSSFEKDANNNGDMYVMRFTSKDCPSNSDYPTVGPETRYTPPCTENGFLGSSDLLIPEYEYSKDNGSPITDGAIYKIEHDGTETIVAYWDSDYGYFMPVKGKGDN